MSMESIFAQRLRHSTRSNLHEHTRIPHAEGEEGKVEEVKEEKQKKTKKVKEVQHEWNLLNKQKPIW